MHKPTTFQGFWHGPALGPLRSACLASFLSMGHRFELFVYEQIKVPKGIILNDANEIIPQTNIFYYNNPITRKPDLGPFSDLFRFKLLSERGGWWSDVDAICLSPSIPEVDRAWAQENPLFNPTAIGTSQIAFRMGDPLVFELYKRCLTLSKTDFHPREALGPQLLSSTIRDFGLSSNNIGTAESFYPVQWIEMYKLWLPEFRGEIADRATRALFMPIYASFPMYMGLQLGRLPPEGSFLSDVCYRFIDELGNGSRYPQEEVREAVKGYFYRNRSWALRELVTVSGIHSLTRLGLGSDLALFSV